MKVKLKKSLALFLSLLICLNTGLVFAEGNIEAKLEGQVELEKEEGALEAKKEEAGETNKEDLSNEDIKEEVENIKDKEEDDLGREPEEIKEEEAEPNRGEIQLEEDRKTEEREELGEEKEVEDLDIYELYEPEEESKLEGRGLASEDEYENFDLEWFDYDEKNGCIILKKLNDKGKDQETIEIPGKYKGKQVKILGNIGMGNETIGFFPSFKNSKIKVLKVVSKDESVEVEGDSLAYAFYNNTSIENIDLSGLDTSNITNMESMYLNSRNLNILNLGSKFDTSDVNNMESMFQYCVNLRELDLDMFNTSNVSNMKNMFMGCINIEKLDLSSFNTSNVIDMESMFEDYHGESLNLSSFNTSRVINMGRMFTGCINIKELDLNNFDTIKVKDMNSMFWNCWGLEKLYIREFNTFNVEDMGSMFAGCSSLTELKLDNFDTSNVKIMYGMFAGSVKLIKLDLSSFDTSKVENMERMFADCSSLVGLDLSNFNTRNVEDMSIMFAGCDSLIELDLSNFNTSNAENMEEMFYINEDKELLVITDDEKLLGYDYKKDNRIPREMKFKIIINAGEGKFEGDGNPKSRNLYEFENSTDGKVAYRNKDLEFSKEEYDEFFQANNLVANKSNEKLVGFKDTIGEEYTLLGLKDYIFNGKNHINILDFIGKEEERTYTAIYKRSTNNGSDKPTRPDKDKPGEKPDKPEEKPDKPAEKPSEVTPQKPSTPEEQNKVDRYKGGDRSEREDLIGMIIEEQIDYELNKTDHLAYLKGYKDDTVRPEGNLTREEAAMVFYRLMEPEFREEVETEDQDFTDVENGRWSEKAIATLANAEMITGYKDGSFKPTKEITRAEVSSMIGKLTDTIILPTDFKDIVEHWAEDYINSVEREGWIRGYEDGSFKPNALIKRSEFVTIVNSILERQVKKENILEGIKVFKDLEENKWYYEQVIEATNGHKYVIKDGEEVWTELDKREFE